jgi:beta-D-xylosidase 4
MTVTSKFLKWSVILLGVTRSAAIPSIQLRQGKCLPASNENYTASISFMGCYTDDNSRVLQGGSATPAGGNTPQTCANACGMSGFTYAGVEYGS